MPKIDQTITVIAPDDFPVDIVAAIENEFLGRGHKVRIYRASEVSPIPSKYPFDPGLWVVIIDRGQLTSVDYFQLLASNARKSISIAVVLAHHDLVDGIRGDVLAGLASDLVLMSWRDYDSLKRRISNLLELLNVQKASATVAVAPLSLDDKPHGVSSEFVRVELPEVTGESSVGAEIEIYLDPGHASQNQVQDIFRALNNLHVASGGLGLEFHVDGQFVTARQEALV